MVLEEEFRDCILGDDRRGASPGGDTAKGIELDLAGISVMVCMPAHRDIPVPTVTSLVKTQFALGRLGIPVEYQIQWGGSLVQAARSKAAQIFLESDKNRLFWIDSDMSWEPDQFMRLLALSSRLDVVGAVYCAKQDVPLFLVHQDKPNHVIETNELGCIPLDGFGLGFTVIQRHVMEKLAEEAPRLRTADADTKDPIPFIFRTGVHNGAFCGEDMLFFGDCKRLGFQPWMDPSIVLGHVGQKTFTADFRDHMMDATVHPTFKEN